MNRIEWAELCCIKTHELGAVRGFFLLHRIGILFSKSTERMNNFMTVKGTKKKNSPKINKFPWAGRESSIKKKNSKNRIFILQILTDTDNPIG